MRNFYDEYDLYYNGDEFDSVRFRRSRRKIYFARSQQKESAQPTMPNL